jgi:hypothetical protein
MWLSVVSSSHHRVRPFFFVFRTPSQYWPATESTSGAGSPLSCGLLPLLASIASFFLIRLAIVLGPPRVVSRSTSVILMSFPRADHIVACVGHFRVPIWGTLIGLRFLGVRPCVTSRGNSATFWSRDHEASCDFALERQKGPPRRTAHIHTRIVVRSPRRLGFGFPLRGAVPRSQGVPTVGTPDRAVIGQIDRVAARAEASNQQEAA